ncbi:MAG: TetR/AcrR family transcriptional regulator [Nitrospirae bacterium]|nr:TetR/AcrR family transcriptional regulator [Nitrospirota bacterium]
MKSVNNVIGKRGDTYQRLLAATLKLISLKGYTGTSTREISSEAGVTEVTLFRHFGSKERLFEETLKNYSFLPELKVLLPELENNSFDYSEGLIRIGTRFVETLKERKLLVRIMTCEIQLYPEKIKEVHSRFIDEMINLLADYFSIRKKNGLLRNFQSEIAAKAFLGMIFSFFHMEEIVKGRNLGKNEIKRNIEEFVYIFTDGTLRGD